MLLADLAEQKVLQVHFEYLSIGKAEGLWLIVDLELAACQTGQNTGFSREQEKNEEFEERVKATWELLAEQGMLVKICKHSF